jgi:hypothetical protein
MMAGERKALIVANGEYDDAGLRRLRSPVADADALAEVLGDREIGAFDVQVVRDEDAHGIQGRIEDLFLAGGPDDVLLLHFSCHGLKSESGELFFAARNTRPDRLGSTAVPAEFVQRCMRMSRSHSIILMLDCCYGGAFGQGVAVRASGEVNVLDNFSGGRGRAVITASNSMEYAFEGGTLADEHDVAPSVFTAALVEGLATGDADRDEDGWIALGELYEYLFDRVRERNPNQTPSRDIEMQGELYLARSKRRRIKPLPVPADLQAAIVDPNMFTRLGAVTELRARLASDNLEAAAGAFEALTHMARADITNVADAASEARQHAFVRVAEENIHFGQIVQGSDVRRSVRLLGPPLARTCTFEASDSWIRLAETAEGVDISVVSRETGVLRGSVVVTGPTGRTEVSLDVEVIPADTANDPDPDPEPPAAAASPIATAALRRDPFAQASGFLAISAGLVVFMGMLPYYRNDDPLPQAAPELTWYVLIIAAVAATAGGCTLLPGTPRTIGLGILLGAAFAAVPGFQLFFVESADTTDGVQTGYWLELIGHVMLMLVAIPATWAVKRAVVARLVRRLLRIGYDWIMVGLGGVGAAALALQYLQVVDYSLEAATTTITVLYLWTAATAFVMPWCAVASVPPKFGLAGLAGWIATGSAIFLASNALLADDGINRVPGTVFECTLLLLAVTALGSARHSAAHPSSSPDALRS